MSSCEPSRFNGLLSGCAKPMFSPDEQSCNLCRKRLAALAYCLASKQSSLWGALSVNWNRAGSGRMAKILSTRRESGRAARDHRWQEARGVYDSLESKRLIVNAARFNGVFWQPSGVRGYHERALSSSCPSPARPETTTGGINRGQYELFFFLIASGGHVAEQQKYIRWG